MGYLLNNALIQYGIQFLAQRNYKPVRRLTFDWFHLPLGPTSFLYETNYNEEGSRLG
jgi:hypothetical protein